MLMKVKGTSCGSDDAASDGDASGTMDDCLKNNSRKDSYNLWLH